MGGVSTIIATSETNPHDAHGKVINVWWRGFEPPSRSARFFPCCIHQLPHHNGKSIHCIGSRPILTFSVTTNSLTCCVPVTRPAHLCRKLSLRQIILVSSLYHDPLSCAPADLTASPICNLKSVSSVGFTLFLPGFTSRLRITSSDIMSNSTMLNLYRCHRLGVI